jgi:hypothetical protein
MLRVWTDFSKYIDDQNSTGRTTTSYSYPVTPSGAKRIEAFYQQKITGVPLVHDLGYMKQYRIEEDWDVLLSNCTTLSIEGAKQALPHIDDKAEQFDVGRGLSLPVRILSHLEGWPDGTFLPADLSAELANGVGDLRPIVQKYSSHK